MPKYYDDWNILSRLQEDIEFAMIEISEIIVEDWKNLIDTLFYDAYNPKVYVRTYETRDSISILNMSYNGNNFEIEIGYDTNLIKTYKNAGYWDAHENPSLMPNLFEYGSIIGHDANGIHAMDKLIEDINSGSYNNRLKDKLKKLGYDVTFK